MTENTKIQLPVDQAEAESQDMLHAKLAEKDGSIQENQTITDDGGIVPEDKKHLILASEHIVREALGLFDIDYDALIDTTKNSAYGVAVKRNPQLLQTVLDSENPVLNALKIAVNFKPHAQFMDKYGEEPAAIKEAIRAELLQELKAKREQEKTPVYSPAFAKTVTEKTASKPVKTGLDAIFKD